MEIIPHGVDKKRGVESASKNAGFTLDAIVACGDGENDITLLDENCPGACPSGQ